MASLVFGEYRLPPAETGIDSEAVVPTFRAEFLVPSPAWDQIVVLDISTSNKAAWPSVSTTGIDVARSLRFEKQPEDGSCTTLEL
ncbi:hypothetical protein [Actinomycetospora flava]|uniref:Uncharacterized protein n=1 Tax=Actinomycetospora flava TaxID=3129232 RepID=A0ABU8M9K7_9PSEU